MYMPKTILLTLLFTALSCARCESSPGTETPPPGDTTPKNYYLSSSSGSDSNSGLSPDSPWKSLDRVARGSFNPGDSILLRAGDAWTESAVWTSKFSGTEELPVVVSSYGTGSRPSLSAYSGSVVLTVNNSDYLVFENIEVGPGAGYGVVFGITDKKPHGNITVRNVKVRDMPLAGIFFNDQEYLNHDITVSHCTGDHVEMLFAISSGERVRIADCRGDGVRLRRILDHFGTGRRAGTLQGLPLRHGELSERRLRHLPGHQRRLCHPFDRGRLPETAGTIRRRGHVSTRQQERHGDGLLPGMTTTDAPSCSSTT